jgi:hypothetical protein
MYIFPLCPKSSKRYYALNIPIKWAYYSALWRLFWFIGIYEYSMISSYIFMFICFIVWINNSRLGIGRNLYCSSDPWLFMWSLSYSFIFSAAKNYSLFINYSSSAFYNLLEYLFNKFFLFKNFLSNDNSFILLL